MPFSYVQFMTELMAPQPNPRQPVFAPPRLAPLREDIWETSVAFKPPRTVFLDFSPGCLPASQMNLNCSATSCAQH
jgi:hypothetical protein